MNGKIVYRAALFTGLLCMVQSAQAQSFSPPWDDPMVGYMIVYLEKGGAVEWDGGGAGTDKTGPYDFSELITIPDGAYTTFDFLPETNKFWNGANGTNYWQNASGTDGCKYLDSLTFWSRAVIGTETNVQLEFTVNSNTFDTNRYEFAAFIKIVNVGDGSAYSIVETNLNAATAGASYTLNLPMDGSHNGAPLQAGFRVSGTNANPANAAAYGGANITVNLYLPPPCDPQPPSPDPLTWAVEPYTISDDKIGMTATTATDLSGVEYQFIGYYGTSIPGGGLAFVSDWQDSPHYVAEGLSAGTTYTVRARAQDLALNCGPNSTGFTTLATATTVAADTTAPTPDPAEIATITASPISVWLTATPATDESAVEYNFMPTGTNGTASGWQESNEYIDYGLTPETSYEYTVQVRDLSAATNMTAVSAPASITTLPVPFSISLINDLKSFTAGDGTEPATLHSLAMAGFEVASLDADRPIIADSSGLTFGNYQGIDGTYTDRNILRTIAAGYAACDFVIEATFVYSNQIEQVCFIGAGHGLLGQYGVPDFFLAGVSGVLTETSNAAQKLFGWFEGTLQDIAETNGIVTLENRVRLTYTADPTPVAIYEIDYDNDGAGVFVADFTLGPISLTNVWQIGAPRRIYIGGGAGTRLYDLAITSVCIPPPPPSPYLSIISVIGDTVTLQWTGVSGQTYNVQYKTNLTDVSWTPDAANQDVIGVGQISVTSTVVGDEVFYQVESE